MKRTTSLPLLALAFAALFACDVTQELQGPGQNDGGTVNPPANDGGNTPPVDGGTTTDSGVNGDAGVQRQISVCVPKSEIGTTSIAVTGRESGYIRDVNDITSGGGRAFVLSTPWTFIGVPLSGSGPVEAYSVTATLPTFAAMAIAPTDTSPGGALSSAALASYNIPGSNEQIVALRGSASFASQIVGRVMVDQGDVFYFETKAPSRLVHAGTKSSPNEILLAEYPTLSNRIVTAAALVGNDVYFTTAINGSSQVDAKLHRVPRNGGAITDLVDLSSIVGQIEAIHVDGNSLYLTPGGEQASVAALFGIYSIANNTVALGSLQGNGQNYAYTRSSGIVFDGSAFYYGSRGDNCSGVLVRVSKDMAVNHFPGQAQVLASNLDRIARLRSYGGNLYVGTAGDPFFKPAGYPGQLLRWTP
ncbi:MAG: hypothetical protein U0174_02860 [Polyangiaceae bacterium]